MVQNVIMQDLTPYPIKQAGCGSISKSVITGCYVQEKRFWEIVAATIEDLAFGVSSGQWSQKHAAFAPAKEDIRLGEGKWVKKTV